MPTQVFEPDEQLTAIAIGYKNDKENYIADKILPYIPVESAQFSYNEYPLEEGFSVPDTKVGRVSAPKTVDFSAMKHTAEVEDHALDVLVPNWDKDVYKRQGILQKPHVAGRRRSSAGQDFA